MPPDTTKHRVIYNIIDVEHGQATILFTKPVIYAENMFLLKFVVLLYTKNDGKNISIIDFDDICGNPHRYQFHIQNYTRFNQRTIYENNLLPINSDKLR